VCVCAFVSQMLAFNWCYVCVVCVCVCVHVCVCEYVLCVLFVYAIVLIALAYMLRVLACFVYECIHRVRVCVYLFALQITACSNIIVCVCIVPVLNTFWTRRLASHYHTNTNEQVKKCKKTWTYNL